MDIQNIDLRRGDFEGMHPKAKLFGFDEDKKLYTGDGVESINDQWTTWCACIGMLHLGGKEAQAVPEGFVLIKDDTKTVVAIERMVEQQVEASGMDSRRLERLDGWKIIEAAVKAQEQK